MYLNDDHPRARAINAFIEDIVNKECKTVNEARQHILNLQYFCRAPQRTFHGILHDNHDEYILLIKLCHCIIDDLIHLIKSVYKL